VHKKLIIAVSVALIVMISGSFIFARPPKRPLTKMEVLALVAGHVFPANIVRDIQARGIAFTTDDNFNSLMTTAGASEKVLAALAHAQSRSSPAGDSFSDQAFLQHLSYASSLISSGDRNNAASELKSSLSNKAGRSAAGFVMGEVLIRGRQFEEAAQVYAQILEEDSDFPELHERLSLALAENGDDDQAFREAKLALQENPDDAVAHRSAGIALRGMQNYPAAKLELEASIRCKPDYDLAYGSLGILLDDMHDYAGAVAQYKKTLTLNPANVNARYNLGLTYSEMDDHVSAIREYREAKRLDPSRLDVHQNLGGQLMHTDPAAAIAEFQELVALAPDFPICHFCLGNAYYNVGRLPEAQKEFQTASDGDPTDARPRRGIGLVLESQNNYDGALVEYRRAQALDPSDSLAFGFAGRVLLLKKDFPAAIAEFKKAEDLDSTDWQSHAWHGQALEASGDRNRAIAEY
jgi:tetratricopeptide (TPR) repeat protein